MGGWEEKTRLSSHAFALHQESQPTSLSGFAAGFAAGSAAGFADSRGASHPTPYGMKFTSMCQSSVFSSSLACQRAVKSMAFCVGRK